MQNSAKSRFEIARKRLSDAFIELEGAIKNKIQESFVSHSIASQNRDYDETLEAKIIEQDKTISQLHQEINNLQNSLEQAGKEVEFLNEKSKVLGAKLNEMRSQSLSIVEMIENDLIKIEELISEEK